MTHWRNVSQFFLFYLLSNLILFSTQISAKLQITRCMGCYAYKGGYKDCELYAKLASEPVISTPEIVEGQQIDGSFQ